MCFLVHNILRLKANARFWAEPSATRSLKLINFAPIIMMSEKYARINTIDAKTVIAIATALGL